MRNPCLAGVLEELAKVGTHHPEIAPGGKHVQVRWANTRGAPRKHAVPGTPSDWRTTENVRRDMRQLLRADGMGWQGRKASSGLTFAWFVWERGYRGHPITQRISWEDGRDAVPVLLPQGGPTKGSRLSSQIKRGANRAYVLARLRRDGREDLINMVESGTLSVRSALAAMTDKQSS
jgi:hypothetical protein